MCVAFANAKATHIYSAEILAFMTYLMINVLTNDIVSFKQLGPACFPAQHTHYVRALL